MDFDLLKIQSHLLWGFGGGRGEYLLAWWPPVCVYSATIFGFRFPFFVPFLPPLGWMIVSFSLVRWGAVDGIFMLWWLLKFNTNISCNIFFFFFLFLFQPHPQHVEVSRSEIESKPQLPPRWILNTLQDSGSSLSSTIFLTQLPAAGPAPYPLLLGLLPMQCCWRCCEN